MKNWRRYEILLPLRLNDGRPTPPNLLAQTLEELECEFGAISCETQVIQGRWQSGGRVFRDDLIRIYVDTEKGPRVEAFFIQLKGRLKQRFEQLDIWVTSHTIRVL